MAVASSKPTVYVQRILEHFKIARYFKVVVGSELDGRRVNKSEVVQEALAQLFGDKPVEPDKVYMIGDRCFDVEGAHSKGIESVGVAYGYGSMEELKQAKSDYIVRTVEELRGFLLRKDEESQPQAGSREAMQMLLSILIFYFARYAGFCLAQMFFMLMDSRGPEKGLFILYSAEGVPERLTGNAAAFVSAFGFLAGAAAVSGMAKKALKQTAAEMKLFHLKRKPKKSYVLLVTAVVGAVLGLNMLLELTGITAWSASYQSVSKSQYASSLWVGLICYGIIAPIAEELLFRGILYGSLRRMRKPFLAAVISAALFGVYHGNFVQGIYAFVMGCLIVYIYEYFGGFRYAVGVHMAANLLVYCLGSIVPEDSGFVSIPVCTVCLACAAGSVYLLHKQKVRP